MKKYIKSLVFFGAFLSLANITSTTFNSPIVFSQSSVSDSCSKANLKIEDRIEELKTFQRNSNNHNSKIVKKALERTKIALDLKVDVKVISAIQEATTRIQQDSAKMDSDINSLTNLKQKLLLLDCTTNERKTLKATEKNLFSNLDQSEKVAYEYRKSSFWPAMSNLTNENFKIAFENEKKSSSSASKNSSSSISSKNSSNTIIN